MQPVCFIEDRGSRCIFPAISIDRLHNDGVRARGSSWVADTTLLLCPQLLRYNLVAKVQRAKTRRGGSANKTCLRW